MKLRLIATIKPTTLEEIFKAYPELKIRADKFRNLPNDRARDQEANAFKYAIDSTVGWGNNQEVFDSSLAFDLVYQYGWPSKPKPSRTKKRKPKKSPPSISEYNWLPYKD